MTMVGEVYLVLAIVFTSVSHVLYKSFFKTRSWLGLCIAISLFALTPLMAYLSLKTMELSRVYIATGLTYVLVLVLAKVVLGETIGRRKIQAMLLIICGVVVFNY